MTSLFIATPAFGEMSLRSLFGLQHVLGAGGWPCALATLSFSDVVESRSVLLSHWFDRTNASHLLFIDADMGFDPKLIVDMVELDQPVVGVIYPKRKLDLTKYETAIAAGDAPARKRTGPPERRTSRLAHRRAPSQAGLTPSFAETTIRR